MTTPKLPKAAKPAKPSRIVSPKTKIDFSRYRNIFIVGVLMVGIIVAINLSRIATSTFIPSSPTPEFPIGSTTISEIDGATLVFVPAGEFIMGSYHGESAEQPVHTVNLDAYWIDQTEVTNAMYSKCVDANQCNLPTDISSTDTHYRYFGNSEFDNYPVIYVSWNDAVDYCTYVNRRLPTEAEWEKAARGTDGNIYPWGNTNPTDTSLNFNFHVGDTNQAGSYTAGASIYGALDMAGNVWEWVSSMYQPYPYDMNDGRENLSSSDSRVLRGGSWNSDNYSARSAFRSRNLPANTGNFLGFRCSRGTSQNPITTPQLPITTPTKIITKTPVPPPANPGLTPEPPIGSTTISEIDGATLVFVPAGEFTMGSETNDDREKPIHQVYLDAYWIDQTEVTNAMYARCVDANQCNPPTDTSSDTHSSYFGNSEFDNYPVIYVSWNDAKDYCEYAGRRLPTEAEWEKAARGEDGNIYPWGDDFDVRTTLRLNFSDKNVPTGASDTVADDGYADVSPVGNYPAGASVYGALDMAGNIWEWVSSLYEPYPYDVNDGREDLNSSDERAWRGGSWYVGNRGVRSAFRSGKYPSFTDNGLGVRCSRGTSP